MIAVSNDEIDANSSSFFQSLGHLHQLCHFLIVNQVIDIQALQEIRYTFDLQMIIKLIKESYQFDNGRPHL